MKRLLLGGIAVGAGAVGCMDIWWDTDLKVIRRADGAPDTYWMATCVEKAVKRGKLEGDIEGRVVVVGGGLAGLHTALNLAERGVGVVVLEASKVGWGASGMSKGLAVAGLQVDTEDIAGYVGTDIATRIHNLTLAAQSRLHHLIDTYGIQCRRVTTGGVHASILSPPSDAPLGTAEIQQITGSKLYKWGEREEDSFGVDPLGLTRGLARACEEKGVKIYENTEARKLRKEADGWLVETPEGSVRCKEVVLCGASQLSPSVHMKLAKATVPVYTWMAATQPLGDRLPVKGDAPLMGDDFVTLNYWRNSPDGRLLFGSLADTYPCPWWLASWRLRRRLKQVYPELADVKFEYLWGGTLCFTTDAVPLIGKDSKGVWYATGFGGHGIVPTCMAGDLLGSAIAEGDERWKMFGDNFKPKYNFWPFSRIGGTLVIQFFNTLDAMRVRGIAVPDIPRPW